MDRSRDGGRIPHVCTWCPGGLVGLADPSAFHARVGVAIIHVSDCVATPVTCVSERCLNRDRCFREERGRMDNGG